MFALDVSNTRRPPSNQMGRKPDTPLSRSFLSDVDRGRVTVEQVHEMTRKRLVATPNTLPTATTVGRPPRTGTPSCASLHGAQTAVGSSATGDRSMDLSTVRAQSPAQTHALRSHTASPQHSCGDAFTSFAEICERTKDGVQPSWLVAKAQAEATRHAQAARHENRRQFLRQVHQSVGTAEAIEIARMVANQEALSKRTADRNSVEHQVNRFAELELKAREGLVSREERRILRDVATCNDGAHNEEEVIDRTLQRHRMRSVADKPFRNVEPQHMAKMASQKILKEEELKSFGDELSLLASKSDTARLIGGRNKDARKTLMQQLMSWAQSVLARGDLSDMLEDFIKDAKRTKDGSILLEDIHTMMTGSGLMLTKQERQEFDDAVDPRSRGCVIPDRLRQVWRSHDAVRKVKAMDQEEAEIIFDAVRQENPGPITATFLSNWLKRTGAPIDPDACHTIVTRLPRPLTKEVIFSEHVFQFLQDVWLDARAATRDVMSDAGMVDRARQLEALGAESNDTLEDVDRASRTMHTSSQRMQQMHGQLQDTLEITAKLARRIPKTYTRAVATNTDVSVFGEMLMLWEGFLVQRDLELLDDTQDEKLTMILSKQNKAKSDEIVRLRTDFENLTSKMRQQVVLLSQQLDASEMNVSTLRSQVEQLTVGPGGQLDFEDQSSLLDAHKREVNELMQQMNAKLSALRSEGQAKVRELIAEVAEHKLRADEAERQLLEELENIRQAEARWVAKIEVLEEDVRGREDTVNNTEQLVSEYEQQYMLQEKRFVELDATLLQAREEIKKLTEQIEIHHSCEDSLVPASELTRQVEAVREALTLELQTERSAKEQFAAQLQGTKSDLQRIEFSFLDKCGTLEQKLHAVSCERDTTEGALTTMVLRVLDLLEAVCSQVTSERTALAHCTDSAAVHSTWVQASHATVDQIATLIDGMHKMVEGMPVDAAQGSAAEVDGLLRRLQQERLREFPVPHNNVLDTLAATRAELDAATARIAENGDELRNAVAFAESHVVSAQRLFAQLAEYAAEVSQRCGRGEAADAPLDAFLSLDGVPKALRTVIHETCSTIQKQVIDAVTAATDRAQAAIEAAGALMGRGQRSNAPQHARTASLDGNNSAVVVHVCGNGVGGLSMPLASVVDTLRTNTQRLHKGATHITEAVVEPLLRATEDLPWVTREDVSKLAEQKQNWRAARRAWSRHLWQLAIHATRHEGRRQRIAAVGSEHAADALASLHALWRTRWCTTASTVLEAVVDAATLVGSVAYSTVMAAAVDPAAKREVEGYGAPPADVSMRRASSSVASEQLQHRTVRVKNQSAATSTTNLKRAPSSSGSSAGLQQRAPSSVSGAVQRAESLKGGSRMSSISTPLASVPSSPAHGTPDPLGCPISESLATSHKAASSTRRQSAASVLASSERADAADIARQSALHEAQPTEEGYDPTHDGSTSRDSSCSSSVAMDEGAMSATSSHLPDSEPLDDGLFPRFQAVPLYDDDVVAVDKEGSTSLRRPGTRSGCESRSVLDGGAPQSQMLRTLRSADIAVEDGDALTAAPTGCAHCGAPNLGRRSMSRSSRQQRHTVSTTSTAIGCQTDAPPAAPLPTPMTTAKTMVSAAVVTDRPSSSNRGSQTPPLPLAAPQRHDDANNHNNVHTAMQPPQCTAATPTAGKAGEGTLMHDALDTPTSSECAWSTVAAQQRRVDSAQRRVMVPRPQSSDRPHSALRLDEESVEALRPPTPRETAAAADGGRNATTHRRLKAEAALTYDSILSLDEMKHAIHSMRQGAMRYVDIEFPRVMEDGTTSSPALEVDCALSYLFDSLAPHCRVAAGKYCLLALFGGISEEVFAEYVFSHHYLPNRNVFVAPQEDELRWAYHALKRIGSTLMRLRRPRDAAAGGTTVATAASRSPLPATRQPAALRARSPVGLCDTSTGAIRSPTHNERASHTERPYSANSFPAAVVVLPLDDMVPSTHYGSDAVVSVDPKVADAMGGAQHTAPRILSQATRWTGPAGTFQVHGARVLPPAVDDASGGDVAAGGPDGAINDGSVAPTQRHTFAPVVALPVQERHQPTALPTPTLPLDRSKPFTDDTLLVYAKVIHQRDGLVACGTALHDVATMLSGGGNEDAAGAPPQSACGGSGRPPSRGPTPTAVELLPHRSASATLTDATRQRLLARPVRKLPPVVAPRPATSPVPPAPTPTGGTTTIQAHLAQSKVSPLQHSVPLSTQRLVPISRPTPSEREAPRTIAPATSDGEGVVVEMPSAVMRRT